MKKRIIIVSIIVVVIILAFLAFVMTRESDAIKFKKEYESLNNTVREGSKNKYHAINIPKDNPIKYVDVKEATDIIKHKTGVIYFGGNWCPWCRNAIPVLIDEARENGLKTIYYLDMTTVRNIWEVKDGKLIKSQTEADGYYDLLKALDSELGDETFKVTDDDKEYDTKEKRIYLPFVVAVKDGKVTSSHVGTVDLNEGQTPYDKLTKKQTRELKDIYNKLIESLDESCGLDEKCS